MGDNTDKLHIALTAYLERISYKGVLSPSAEVLNALHLAHVSSIPFENLDVFLKRPIKLDLAHLQKKLVSNHRGGYCFEQNLLFAAILEKVGFSVRCLAARVRYGTTTTLARTHMVLLVESNDGSVCLADVGFGREGMLLPVPFIEKQVSKHYAWTYRLIKEGDCWVLQSQHNKAWVDMYAFTLEPQLVVDYEVTSHYISTHPNSPFTRTLTVQKPTPEARYRLNNMELLVDDGKTQRSRLLSSETELLEVLEETFGLAFPSGTKFI